MVKTSVLNDALKSINNAEKAGKRQVMIRPSSKVIIKFLSVMQRHGMFELHYSYYVLVGRGALHKLKSPFGLITRRQSHIARRPLPFKCPKEQSIRGHPYTLPFFNLMIVYVYLIATFSHLCPY